MTLFSDIHHVIYDSLPDPVFVTDYQEVVIDLNQAAQSFTGLTREKTEGRKLSRLLPFAEPKRVTDIDSALYRALTTGSSHALHSDHPVDLLIMDLTIPGGMGGKEAIGEILALDPKAKAIVSSGYADDPAVAVKPYPMDKLLETVHRVLANDSE